MKNNIVYIFILSLIISSCLEHEDLDIDYNELNKITITGIEDLYEVVAGENILIEPEISQTLPSSDHRYVWVTRSVTGKLDTLSISESTPTLDVPVNLIPMADNYELELYAYDNNTNVFERFESELSVSTDVAYGLLVLSDLDGTANLDYVRFDGEIMNDMFQKSNLNRSLGEKPIRINYTPGRVPDLGRVSHISILCQNETGGQILDPATLISTGSIKDKFAFLNDDISKIRNIATLTEGYKCNVTSRYFFDDYVLGTAHKPHDAILIDNSVYQGEVLLEYPITGIEQFQFNLHNDIKYAPVGGYLIAFDTSLKQFIAIRQGYSSSYNPTTRFLPIYSSDFSNPSGPFDFTVLRGGLGVSEYGYGDSGHCYIVKDDVSGEYKYLSFACSGSSVYGSGQLFKPVSIDSFTEDSHVAFSNYEFGFYYINSSNQLVYCDASTDTHTIIDDSFGGLEVTAMKIKPIANRIDNTKLETYRLYVATYEGSGRTGSVREYHVNTDDNSDVTHMATYENVGGKIVDMDYKFK